MLPWQPLGKREERANVIGQNFFSRHSLKAVPHPLSMNDNSEISCQITDSNFVLLNWQINVEWIYSERLARRRPRWLRVQNIYTNNNKSYNQMAARRKLNNKSKWVINTWITTTGRLMRRWCVLRAHHHWNWLLRLTELSHGLPFSEYSFEIITIYIEH